MCMCFKLLTETVAVEHSFFLLVKFDDVLINVRYKQCVDRLSFLKIILR